MYPTTNLQPGSSGDAVTQLQKYLQGAGYSIHLLSSGQAQYGYYGPQTQSAVTAMQQKLGVDNSSGPGYYGPRTIAALQGTQSGTQASTQSPPGSSGIPGTPGYKSAGQLADEAEAARLKGTVTDAPSTNTAAVGTADAFLQSYLDSLKPTSTETNLQGQLGDLAGQQANINASRDLGIQGVNEQPIATPFLTGQAAAITNRAAVQSGALGAQQVPLQQRLAIEQARRQSAMDINKTALEYQSNKEQNARTSRYVTLPDGSQLYDTTTGSSVASNPRDYASTSGASPTTPSAPLYGGSSPVTPGAPVTPTGTANTTNTTNTLAGLTSGKTYVSGKLQYTAKDYSEDRSEMRNPNIKDAQGNPNLGSDGYVNPSVYLQLYNSWVSGGGVKADFLKVFPLNTYINPANNWPQIQALRSSNLY